MRTLYEIVEDAKEMRGDKMNAIADVIFIHCAHDELADITTLVSNPRNPNQHPQKQIELLAKIIKNLGWRAPITVSTALVLLCAVMVGCWRLNYWAWHKSPWIGKIMQQRPKSGQI